MGSATFCDRCGEQREPKVRVRVSNLPVTRGLSEFPSMAEICQQCGDDMREAWNRIGLNAGGTIAYRIAAVQIFGESPLT
jgi:hypothetical protein